jgi:hypothetical protein
MAGITLPPNSKGVLGPVYFVPKRQGAHDATLYLRTNLSFLQILSVSGESGTGRLELGDRASLADGAEPPQPCPDDDPQCDVITFDLGASGEGDGGEGGRVGRMRKQLTLLNAGTLPVRVHAVTFQVPPRSLNAKRKGNAMREGERGWGGGGGRATNA